MKIAVRIGDWKLLAALDRNPPPRGNDITEAGEQDFKKAEPPDFELYNLRSDIAETTNLTEKEPAKLAELKAALVTKYHEVREEAPVWPAWKFTGAEGKKIIWVDVATKPKAARPRRKKGIVTAVRRQSGSHTPCAAQGKPFQKGKSLAHRPDKERRHFCRQLVRGE